MPNLNRITGKDGLVLTFGGVDYACDSTAVTIEAQESDNDNVTFCEAKEGGQYVYIMTVSGLSTTVSGGFWRYLFANAGTKNVAYKLNPHGVATATVDKPHFTGTLDIPGGMPTLATEANQSTTFDVEFQLNGKPTLVTTGA